jgi:hypothetical protein
LNIIERENGQLSLAKRTARGRICPDVWQQVKTAYASGIGLREIARNMNIPEGTVLARAKREAWTRQIQNAKALAQREDTPPTITPTEAVAATMQQRGQRHVERMAGVTEKVLPHLEGMEPDEILSRVDQVEKLDKVARRTFGFDNNKGQFVGLRLNVLNVDGSMLEANAYRNAHRSLQHGPRLDGEATDVAEC